MFKSYKSATTSSSSSSGDRVVNLSDDHEEARTIEVTNQGLMNMDNIARILSARDIIYNKSVIE
jgi:hypothetical protein